MHFVLYDKVSTCNSIALSIAGKSSFAYLGIMETSISHESDRNTHDYTPLSVALLLSKSACETAAIEHVQDLSTNKYPITITYFI